MIYDFMIEGGPITGLNILKNFYYDTALSTSPYALKALEELVGSSHILYGSDLPFAQKVAPMVAKDLDKYEGFDEEDLQAIHYENCHNLFPSL